MFAPIGSHIGEKTYSSPQKSESFFFAELENVRVYGPGETATKIWKKAVH